VISPICFPYLGHQERSVLQVAIVESGNMETSDKKVAKEVMGQVIQNIYEREGRDEWAELQKVE
jgi:hypothetical protein